jgi:hypothetical protein
LAHFLLPEPDFRTVGAGWKDMAATAIYPPEEPTAGAAMTTFDEREKSFESKFQHDQELQFKVTARKNKMLGLCAAGLLGKTGDAAEAYAKEVVLADLEKPGDSDVVAKLLGDFAAVGKSMDEQTIRKQAERLATDARAQVMTETR